MSWSRVRRHVPPIQPRGPELRRELERLQRDGTTIEPVVVEGRTIARRFWGRKWCEHIESFYWPRRILPPARTCVRGGSVCHLAIDGGRVHALVHDPRLHQVEFEIKQIDHGKWQDVKHRCAGHIGSMLELLTGELS